MNKIILITVLLLVSFDARSDLYITLSDYNLIKLLDAKHITDIKNKKRPFILFKGKKGKTRLTVGRDYFKINNKKCTFKDSFQSSYLHGFSNLNNICANMKLPILFGEKFRGHVLNTKKLRQEFLNKKKKNRENFNFFISFNDVVGSGKNIEFKYLFGTEELIPQFKLDKKVRVSLGPEVIDLRANRLLKKDPELKNFLLNLKKQINSNEPCDIHKFYFTKKINRNDQLKRQCKNHGLSKGLLKLINDSLNTNASSLIFGLDGKVSLASRNTYLILELRKEKDRWYIDFLSPGGLRSNGVTNYIFQPR